MDFDNGLCLCCFLFGGTAPHVFVVFVEKVFGRRIDLSERQNVRHIKADVGGGAWGGLVF